MALPELNSQISERYMEGGQRIEHFGQLILRLHYDIVRFSIASRSDGLDIERLDQRRKNRSNMSGHAG